ncbi:hypothetical protein TWF696_002645 [Orbilia brochopaga]|uniref:Apple domain-containing protein n=1 Tax=Orbilia brochopaga TaxID=3140254 RepID=A0AAV9U4Q8_9PEZI
MKSLFYLTLLAGASVSSAAAVPATNCTLTAKVVDTICDYPAPGIAHSFAIDGAAGCWKYCKEDSNCKFVIFRRGFPGAGIEDPGNCWVYPKKKYNASKARKCGETESPSLYVYKRPTCATSPPCPSYTAKVIDSICDYPGPESGTAMATDGPQLCWDACLKRPFCNFVIFFKGNPSAPGISGPGTCWMYPSKKYAPEKATKCNGSNPFLFVFDKPVCAA